MSTLSTAQIRTIESKIAKLAFEQGRDAMQVRILFLLERAVVRMVIDPILHKHLIFKGGYVSLRVYGSQRFTTDVDAALNGISTDEASSRIEEALRTDLEDGAWFRYEGKQNTVAQGDYGGLSLKFRAGLGAVPDRLEKALRVSIDLGIGDPVTPRPTLTQTRETLGKSEISWQVYPIETMIAEKLHALLALGDRNSRSKDVFDLEIFWDNADLRSLNEAIHKTFEYRNFERPISIHEDVSKIDRTLLRRGWASATSSLSHVRSFDETFDSLLQKLLNLPPK